MFKDAIAKLQAEMDKNKQNPYIKVIGDFLIQHLEGTPGSAEKILNKDKTIGKSLDEMRKAAEKKKVGNCAMLTDEEGFGIVLKYFGVNGAVSKPDRKAEAAEKPEITGKSSSKDIDFDIKLEDLI